ncbi:hypothetical protein ACFL4W_02140 [Planctomycetota bacterium]
MLANSAAIDISPPAGIFLAGMGWDRPLSPSNHDPIMGRCLILQEGQAKWVLLSNDLIAYSEYDYNRVRDKIEAADPSLKDATLTIACSHNHSGPAGYRCYEQSIRKHAATDAQIWLDYLDMVVDRFAEVILETNRELKDAQIGFGMSESDVNMNRWHIDAEGKAWFIPWKRELEPNHTIDHEMLIMSVQDIEGNAIASVYNYAMHAIVVCLQSDECTADFPGIVARLIEAKVGGQCMFLGGACGDVHPYDFDRGFEAAEKVGARLSEAILSVLPDIEYTDSLDLRTREFRVPIEVCDPDDPNIGLGMGRDDMLMQAIAINGETAFVAIPGEPYIEIALKLKELSGFSKTGTIALANDFVGGVCEKRFYTDYFALKEPYEKHDYEKTCTRPDFTFESTDRLIEMSLQALKEMKRGI